MIIFAKLTELFYLIYYLISDCDVLDTTWIFMEASNYAVFFSEILRLCSIKVAHVLILYVGFQACHCSLCLYRGLVWIVMYRSTCAMRVSLTYLSPLCLHTLHPLSTSSMSL